MNVVWVHFQFFRAPISSNHVQWSVRTRSKTNPKKFVNRRVTTSDARRYREYVQQMVKKQIALLPVEIKEQIAKAKYFMTRYIFIDRYMQVRDSNQPIRKDATNMLKTTEDAVMAELKQDDKRVFHTSLHKIHISDESKGRFILSIAAFDHMPTVREFYEECGRVSDEPYDRLYV